MEDYACLISDRPGFAPGTRSISYWRVGFGIKSSQAPIADQSLVPVHEALTWVGFWVKSSKISIADPSLAPVREGLLVRWVLDQILSAFHC